jgi:hypothetical protein
MHSVTELERQDCLSKLTWLPEVSEARAFLGLCMSVCPEEWQHEQGAVPLLTALVWSLILGRSWQDLQPKLPFLVDAALGAVLDLVILLQFSIYKDVDAENDTTSITQDGHHQQQQQQQPRLSSVCAAGSARLLGRSPSSGDGPQSGGKSEHIVPTPMTA